MSAAGTTPSVLCFGEALWDLLPDGRKPGGAPMNVALRLNSFGVRAEILSRVGVDPDGEALCRFLESRSLSTRFLQTDASQPTGTVGVDLTNPGEIRYNIHGPAAWDFIDAEAFFEQCPSPFDAIVFGSLVSRYEVSRRSLFRLLDAPGINIFDANFRPPFVDRQTIESLLRKSQWVKLNEHEMAEIGSWIGLDDAPDRLMKALRERYEIELLCVTRGSDGVLMLHDGGLIEQSAFDVDVVDTIGCGDAFLGALVAAMLTGRPAKESLERASAVAAIVAASEGANPDISERDIDALLTG